MFAIRASLTGIAFFSLVRRPEFSNSLRWEVAIERGSSDFELPDDVIDEGMVLPVSEQCLGEANFLVIHCARPAALPTATSCGSETRPGVLDNQFTLELVEGRGHVKEQASVRRAGIDVLGEHLERDVSLLQGSTKNLGVNAQRIRLSRDPPLKLLLPRRGFRQLPLGGVVD